MDRYLIDQLNDVYNDTLEAVRKAETNGEDAKWQLQKLSELHKQRMAEEQRLLEEQEVTIKWEQLYDERDNAKFNRVSKTVIDSTAVLLPCVVSSFWMAKGLKFEETGCFTSKVGNWIGGHLRLFKK